MIVVRVAVQQDLDIFDREAEFRDALLDEPRGFGKSAIEQDGTLRGLDIERRNIGGADVINIANDAERLDGLVPFGALIGAVLSIHAEDSASESKRKDESHFV